MRALAVARLGTGLAEVAGPDRVGAPLIGHAPDARERAVIRILGARHLAQFAAAQRGHRLLGGPALDALHAASMLGLAAVSRRYRRSALVSAAGATAFAVMARAADRR